MFSILIFTRINDVLGSAGDLSFLSFFKAGWGGGGGGGGVLLFVLKGLDV